MSLTRKVTIIVTLVFLMSAFASYCIQKIFIMPSFMALEENSANQNAERVLGAIESELDLITTLVTDWSNWTDTYTYVKGQNPDYQVENLDFDNTLDALSMNFVGLFDVTGKAIWSRAEELDSRDPIDLGQLTEPGLSADHPLMQHKNIENNIKGIISTSHGPLLIVAGPILTSDEEGPIAGTLMMGRFLNDTTIERFADLTKLSITGKTTNQPINPSNRIRTDIAKYSFTHTTLALIENPGILQVQTTMVDVFNNPILTLEIDTPRDISAQGAQAVNQSLWVLAATGMLMMLVLWKLLQNAMLRPIAKLTEHALFIGEHDDSKVRLDLNRNDELGVLADTFDQMVDRLAETRRRLVDQSYHSGVAEMASGVLHNIGNAITPLNVRLITLQQELKNAPLTEMELATAGLDDPSTPVDRRADLNEFVGLAGKEMASMIQNSQKELEGSIKQVGQIQEILTDQQRYSHSERVIEPVDIAKLIEDVNAELSPEFKDAMHLEITPNVSDIGAVSVARAALQQVVTNLLINAAESIQSTGTGSGNLTVTAKIEKIQGQLMARLLFTDNGVGIDPKLKGNIFERGFSTKNREGSGYGLHWSANTLLELGGQISAESAGLGSGACIHVLLPLADNQRQLTTESDKDRDELPN